MQAHYLTSASKAVEALIDETSFRCNITAAQCELQNCLAALKRFSKQKFPNKSFQVVYESIVNVFADIYELVDFLNSLSAKAHTNYVNEERLIIISITYKIFDALNELYQYT